MKFNSSTSWGGVDTLGRVWALLGRWAGTVLKLERVTLSQVFGRDVCEGSNPTAMHDEAATAAHLGGWWWQSPESQRTTVQRRAGV